MNHLDEEYGDSGVIVHLLAKPNYLKPFPQDFASFLEFPNLMNWAVDPQSHKLRYQQAVPGPGEALAPFLQAWLFFGLIFTVVKADGKPLLAFDDLVQGNTVDTKKLRWGLEEWAAWERSNRPGIHLRMIRVGWVLEKARQVVRSNCAEIDGRTGYSDGHVGSIDYMSDETALSLMTLGETISAVKIKIMSDVDGAHLNGWHGDENLGWGPPKYVLNKMKNDGWCRRTIHLLKGQLGSSAILLLAAYNSQYLDFDRKKHEEKNCDEDGCHVISEKAEGGYVSRHYPGCKDPDCFARMRGPSDAHMGDIISMLDRDEIPLLQFEDCETEAEGFRLTPVKWTPGTQFAAISHVWAHGYGNEKKNALYKCQLAFIREQLVHVRNILRNDKSQMVPMLFWMDTLVVPVEDKHAAKRQIAISQIFRVFRESTCTIVLDSGLSTMKAGHDGKPAQAAMKVFCSGWMRRLWTLQEAFGSKKIYIPFVPVSADDIHIQEFDQLANNLNNTQHTLTAALIMALRNQLLHNVMGHERQTRDTYLWQSRQPPPKQGAQLITNAWRAARWRTTGNPAHETLALATMLNLDYTDTNIGEPTIQKEARMSQSHLDSLMRDFWITFDEQYKGAIPPGIIFLPSDKIRIPGFGWAPRTWMEAHDQTGYPEPLQPTGFKTVLDKEHGLRVRYPGFLLHTRDRSRVLGINKLDDEFVFPVDSNLLEWYRAKPVDPVQANDNYVAGIRDNNTRLAIILSRPQRGGLAPEIALLVEVWKQRIETQDEGTRKVLYCQVIHRLQVSRERRSPGVSGRAPPAFASASSEDLNLSPNMSFSRRDTVRAAGKQPAAYYSRTSAATASARATSNSVDMTLMGYTTNAETHEQFLVSPSAAAAAGTINTTLHPLISGTRDDDVIIGEAVGPDQDWFVDGFFRERYKPRPLYTDAGHGHGPPGSRAFRSNSPRAHTMPRHMPDGRYNNNADASGSGFIAAGGPPPPPLQRVGTIAGAVRSIFRYN
ncbi:hypothetical protein B0T19DRAFT_383366 [Cercophora scortea]|uniref:Heterokaryon incompatibility domain-containing protein n=1 Tax=Cercophora scortea TaxID=314031 RepID=A0AAE0IZI6_9PEZI|nr:hypothetical protein B0T19DRAFT_383366 [Cercophora scortea]